MCGCLTVYINMHVWWTQVSRLLSDGHRFLDYWLSVVLHVYTSMYRNIEPAKQSEIVYFLCAQKNEEEIIPSNLSMAWTIDVHVVLIE